jgi:hypothetical protein
MLLQRARRANVESEEQKVMEAVDRIDEEPLLLHLLELVVDFRMFQVLLDLHANYNYAISQYCGDEGRGRPQELLYKSTSIVPANLGRDS